MYRSKTLPLLATLIAAQGCAVDDPTAGAINAGNAGTASTGLVSASGSSAGGAAGNTAAIASGAGATSTAGTGTTIAASGAAASGAGATSVATAGTGGTAANTTTSTAGTMASGAGTTSTAGTAANTTAGTGGTAVVNSGAGTTATDTAGAGSSAGGSVNVPDTGTAGMGAGGSDDGAGAGAPGMNDGQGGAADMGAGGTSAEAGGASGMDGEVGESLCPESAVLCEDFEAGNLDQWEIFNNGGSVEISDRFSANGNSALYVDVPANTYGAYLRLTGAPLFPLPDKKMWGRAMVMYETVPDGHTDIVRAADSSSSVPFYNLGSQHEVILLNYYVQYPQEDCWSRPDPDYDLDPGRWMCWEWSMNGNNDEIEFFIDGVQLMTVTGNGSRADDGCVEGDNERQWVAPDFGSFQIGANVAEQSANRTEKFWIDDVAVGTEERLGCPPM